MSPTASGGQLAEATYPQLRFVRPPDATEIVLVRHGETIAADPDEPFELLEGQGDPPLAPSGEAQADRVADRLAGSEIAAIYVTTLRRTSQTAAPLAGRTGLTPVVEADLREIHLGEWEGGVYRQKVAEQDPLALEVFRQQRWDVIPGAESNEAFAERIERGLRAIASRHPGGRVVAVSHGGSIGMAMSIASGARPFSFVGVDNGSLSTVVVSPQRLFVRSYNDSCHLA